MTLRSLVVLLALLGCAPGGIDAGLCLDLETCACPFDRDDCEAR